MTVPSVRSASSGNGSGSAATITKPSGTTSGDLLVAIAYAQSLTNLADLTVTGGTGGWTQVDSTALGTDNTALKIWTRTAGSSEPASYSLAGTSGNSDQAGAIVCVDGSTGTLTVDVTATGTETGTSTTAALVSATTTQADCLLIAGWGHETTGTVKDTHTPPVGWTEQGDTGTTWANISVATKSQASAGSIGTNNATVDATAHVASNTKKSGVIAIYLPSGSASPTPTVASATATARDATVSVKPTATAATATAAAIQPVAGAVKAVQPATATATATAWQPTITVDGVTVTVPIQLATDDSTLLDLDGISLRTDRYRFDLLDSSNNVIGELHPVYAAQVENNSSQSIKRRLTNFHLTATESADVDVLSHRVRPWMVLENGSEYPLGIFLFADASNARKSYGVETEGTLVDQGLILAQQLGQTVGFPAETLVTDAIRQVASLGGISTAYVSAAAASVGAPISWPAGKSAVTYLKILEELCALAGFHPPYFDNSGQLVCRTLSNLDTAHPTLIYRDGGRIISESMIEANDLLSAPNRYIVVDSSATAGAIIATYEVPASAPHSYARRGFFITQTIEAPGVGNPDQALQLAQTTAAQDGKAYETVRFSSPLDPRHDTFDVIDYRESNYLELSWRMTLAPGGPMDHEVKRVYV